MIPGREVLRLVDAFRFYRYGADDVGFPWPLPGVRLPLAREGAPRLTNCCTFAAALLVRALEPAYDYDHHRAWMVQTADRFGPVSSALELGMADPLRDEDWPGAWRLCQGWRENGRGHTFIVVETDHLERCLILEANRAFGLDGVGYRDVGPRWQLGGAPLPAAPATWTWARLRSTYPSMRVCALRIGAVEH